MNYKSISMIDPKRLSELLQRPFGIRMCCHIVMEDSTGVQVHDDEYIEDAESGCDHHEEVGCQNRYRMVVEEG